MRRKSNWFCIANLIMVLGGCNAPTPPPAAPVSSPPPREGLHRLVERYWDERISTDELIAPQRLADALSVERRYLAELRAISREGLDLESRLNYDIFQRQRETNVDGFTYPEELLPLKPFGSLVQKLADAEAESAQHPLSSAELLAWQRRIEDYRRWTQQAMVNLKEGVRRGYTLPRAVVERTLPQLEQLQAQSAPAGLPAAASGQLQAASRALHDYLLREYLPKARPGLALSELPLGRAWYLFRVRRATGSVTPPSEINRLGAAEVERLHAKMPAIAPPEAMADAPPEATSLLAAYAQLQGEVTAKLDVVFTGALPTELQILASDREEEAGSPLYYSPPATLFVLVHPASGKPMLASFLQQALPGQHFQQSFQANQSLPRFRRFSAEPAYVAGWGLYAAGLGDDLGLYPDDAGKYQLLALQMRCAAAMVVDTGIHALGWTRTRALDYLHEHLNMSDAEAQARVDGYAGSPGDALACMMGGLKFQSLRAHAQQALGARFEIREFHTQLLKDGAMPLDILDAKLQRWLESSR